MSRSWSRLTSGFNSTLRTTLKIAALAPMPSASVTTTVKARPLTRVRDRKAMRKSAMRFMIVLSVSTALPRGRTAIGQIDMLPARPRIGARRRQNLVVFRRSDACARRGRDEETADRRNALTRFLMNAVVVEQGVAV